MKNVMKSSNARTETAVTEKTERRRFTAEYKHRILREVSLASKPGEVGAILRREGLYSSHLANWRKQSDDAARSAVSPKKRGPAKRKDERDDRIAELEREQRKLLRRAERAEALVEVQKKVSELLGIVLPSRDEMDL